MKRTPLHYAAADDDVSRVVHLLVEGYEPYAVDVDGSTPLHFAAQNYSVAAAHALLDSGSMIDSVNKFGNTPLFCAVFTRVVEVALLFCCGRVGRIPGGSTIMDRPRWGLLG
ncbi:ankyrin repeat domain-containing protein [Candidatus Protofrankia californiensis]|uniref:ankyrin repeat domain-containing protein n=1 Tax=Candidatus Protofrankia californiensis TaxID=1839754 RepID=UPI0019CFC91E|nr:ankyrin repeat domain-containing protein [Candidatus Protofrankia californiensis]